MKLFSYLTRAPKRASLFLLALFALVALPVNSVMAVDALMEGSIGVANQTTGETNYKPNTSAKYDEVVKFSVYYHNRELADSGRVAENFKIKIDFPTAAGTNQVVKVTMKGSNTNTITDTASVTLNRADAHLEFIPGSTYWKHNVGTRANPDLKTVQIADSVILNGTVIEDVKPCHEFEATVTFMARVRVPSVSINKIVVDESVAGATGSTTLSTQPGKQVRYAVTVKNLGNANLTNVYMRDPLPKGLTIVPGSAKKYYGEYKGTVMTADEVNAFLNGRKNVGTLLPGARADIIFSATIDSADKLACGVNTIKNIAVVDTDQTGEYNNSATVTVNKTCEPTTTQAARCDSLVVTKLNPSDPKNRGVSLKLNNTVSGGATFKNVTYDFGDGTPALVTDKTAGVEHTYAKDGEYALRATVRFTVNGAEKASECEAKVVFTATPETPQTPVGPAPQALPNTGAGAVASLFAATSAVGAAAHHLISRRRD